MSSWRNSKIHSKWRLIKRQVFILITILGLFLCTFLVCLSKIISAFNITMRVFSLQSYKYLHHKTDKHGFYFQYRFHIPHLLSLSDCFVLLHKTKIRTLKKDNYKWGNTQEHRLRTLVFTAWLKKTFKGRDGGRW